MVTTIQLEERIKTRLNKMKLHPRETYNKVIERLIHDTGEEELSPQTIRGIESALNDIKNGRLYSSAEVRKRLKKN